MGRSHVQSMGFDDRSKTGKKRAVSKLEPLPVEVAQQTIMGDLGVSEMTPQIQIHFPYSINADEAIPFPGNGGSVSNGNNHANISTGTETDGFGVLLSREILKQNPGQGSTARFGASFTTGVAQSEQIVGCGNGLNGLFFGYDNADFGVLRRTGGAPELRKLTITTASTTTENVSITLDGITVTDVAVTNSGDTATTAREIADHSYAGVGTGWGARVAGNVVTFISLEPISKSGSYTLSSATTAIGAFTLIGAGVAPTNSWITQTSWNLDSMIAGHAGNTSGNVLDTTKGNEYQISFCGSYGNILFSIVNEKTGKYNPVHMIQYANNNTNTSIDNPSFPMFANATNIGNTSSLTIKVSTLSAFVEGKELELGTRQTIVNSVDIGNSTDETPIFTIRNKQIYQNIINQVRLTSISMTLTSILSANKAFTIFRIYSFARPEGGASYADVSPSSSVVEADVSGTTFDLTLPGAETIDTYVLGPDQSIPIDFSRVRDRIAPGGTVMVTGQVNTGHADNVFAATLNWKELT